MKKDSTSQNYCSRDLLSSILLYTGRFNNWCRCGGLFWEVWVTRAQLSRIHTYVQSVPMENRSIITYKTLCEVEPQVL
jgi:hypothetical protein